MTNKKNKALQAVVVLLLTAALVFTSTFAWMSFTQSKINVFADLQQPNVNLHDDFAEGPNKDIYVENSGNTPSYLRVRLTEYLQTELRGSLVQGHLYEEVRAHDWAPHNGMKTITESGETNGCTLMPPNVTSAAWGSDTFHDYYTWQMGGSAGNPAGQIYYLPATEEQRGGYAADGTTAREPQVVSNPLTAVSAATPMGDAHLVYADQVKELIAADKGTAGGTGENDYPDIDPADPDADKLLAAAKESKAMDSLGIQKTRTASVINMTQWKTGNGLPDTDPAYRAPYAMGNYWVMDADGWCYWTGALEGGEATGLLLEAVTRTPKTYDSNAEYAINVWLQAVDGSDIGRFETPDAGGMTDDGKKLIALVSGKIVTDTGGNDYLNNGNGTYTPAAPDGSPAPDKPPFVPLGDKDVNTPVENRLELGQRITLDTLDWDGDDYRNWETESTKPRPWYNVAKTTVIDSNMVGDKPIYEIMGSSIGLDGVTYLDLSGLVLREGTTDEYIPGGELIHATAVMRTQTRAAGSYAQTNPGNGPLAFVWAGGDDKLGDSDDTRLDPSIPLEKRYFYHLGSGVYLETAEENGTVSRDTPTKYFFAGKAVSDTVDNHLTVMSIAKYMVEKIDALFPLQLGDGDKFNVTETVTGGQTKVTVYKPATNGTYTLTKMEKGADGKLYIDLGNPPDTKKLGYLAVGSDEYLGNDGDVRVWAGTGGIGSGSDFPLTPYVFSETFLADKTVADLEPGGKFTAGGKEWLVLETNFGAVNNRLIVSTFSAGTSQFNKDDKGTKNVYAGSDLEKQMKSPTTMKMTAELAGCVQPVIIYQFMETLYNPTGAKVTFPLSVADLNKYKALINGNWNGSIWWTRTNHDTLTGAVYTSDLQAVIIGDYFQMRPAAVVKFSH